MNLAKQRGVAPREVWFRVLEMSAESRALLWRERGQWDRPVETEQSVLRPVVRKNSISSKISPL
jgi:hypothetical protein